MGEGENFAPWAGQCNKSGQKNLGIFVGMPAEHV
jgi:hypothetical protein